jgi:hypothetical protein
MTTPLWKGPLIEGITQSMIGKFIQCPYRFYLYAVLGKVDNKPLPDNLIWGDVYHKGLELLIRSKDLAASSAGMLDYLRTKYPQAPATYETSTTRLLNRFSLASYQGEWLTEQTFRKTVQTATGREVVIRGKKDAVNYSHPEYGNILGEHKCKGYIDPVRTGKELSQDRQVNIYCYLHNIEWVNYDLILIPEAVKYKPARSYNETPQEWMSKLFTGPCGSYGMFPINQNAHQWIYNGTYHLPREEQENYWNYTVRPDLDRICVWWDWVTQSGFDPDNPKFYNHIFYRTPVRQFEGSNTEKFECDYYSYLIGDSSLDELTSITSLYNELEEV